MDINGICCMRYFEDSLRKCQVPVIQQVLKIQQLLVAEMMVYKRLVPFKLMKTVISAWLFFFFSFK